MTDETTTETTEENTQTTEEEKDWKAEADKWKAMARKHEGTAKANAEAAKRLDEIEQSSKTELEKAQARAEAAEKAANDATAKALKSEIAASKGVPLELLFGSDRDDLEASADAILAFIKGATPAAPSSAGQGNVGTAVSKGQPNTDDWFRDLANNSH